MITKRPALVLFICAFLGALFGLNFEGSWPFYALLALVLVPILRVPLLSIMSVLLFTFFMTAYTASEKNRDFLEVITSLPAHEGVFYGEIFDVSKKRDGNIVAMAHLSSQGLAKGFKAKLRFKEAMANLKIEPGQEVLLKGTPKPNQPPLSSVHFDAYRYGLVHDLHANFIITKPSSFWFGKGSKKYFRALKHSFSNFVLSSTTPHEASLLLALMIGDTGLFSEEQNDIYQMLGVQHLLAVSGLQVTLLSGLAFFLLIPFFALMLPRSYSYRAQALAAVASLFLTFGFIGLCGFSSSALRAFLMSAFLLLPHLWARKIDVFDAFFAAGFISILLWPTSVIDLGFLLSYAAVLAMLIAHKRSEALRAFLTARSILLGAIASLIIGGMAAFLGTLPIIAAYFYSVAPFSIFANLLLVPVASMLQIPAIIFGLLGCVLKQAWLIKAAIIPANLIEVFAETLYLFLGKIIFLPHLSSWLLFLGSLAFLLLFLFILKKNFYLLLLSLVFLALPLAEIFFKPQLLEVVLIPVGQGDSTLFSLPNGQNILIDAAGQPYGTFDPGKSIILPTLQKRGVKKLDALIITHPDPDHILGAFALIDAIPIKEIWHSGFLPTHPLTMRLKEAAFKKNIPIIEGPKVLGAHHLGETTIQVLAPNHPEKAYFEEHSSNNNSLVIKISYGSHKLLWPGDLEALGEKLLLNSEADIEAQILKAPHHGSKTSSTEQFINSVSPKIVLYSTGQNNRFNFPHKEVVKRYRDKNIDEYNTATVGEVTIKLLKDKMFIESFRPSLKKKT